METFGLAKEPHWGQEGRVDWTALRDSSLGS